MKKKTRTVVKFANKGFRIDISVQITAQGQERTVTMGSLNIQTYARGGMIHILPRQAWGTCYMYTALHCAMNHQAMFSSVLRMLKYRITTSKYAAKAGESTAESSSRRGFKKDLKLTMRQTTPVEWMDTDPNAVDGVIEEATHSEPELFDWIRWTNLYVAMVAATQLTDDQRHNLQSKKSDQLFAMMIKKQHDYYNQSEDQIQGAIDGGQPYDAFVDLMRNVGATVKQSGSKNELSVITFPEVDGATALLTDNFGKPPTDTMYLGADRVGVVVVDFKKGAEKSAHAVCYFRQIIEGVDTLCIIDSNYPYAVKYANWIYNFPAFYGGEILKIRSCSLFVGKGTETVRKRIFGLFGGGPEYDSSEISPEIPDEPEGKAVVDAILLQAVTGDVELDPDMAANASRAREILSNLAE